MPTDAEIKEAWRAQMQAHHPDRPGGSTEKAAQINSAADALSTGELTRLVSLFFLEKRRKEPNPLRSTRADLPRLSFFTLSIVRQRTNELLTSEMDFGIREVGDQGDRNDYYSSFFFIASKREPPSSTQVHVPSPASVMSKQASTTLS